MADPGTSTDAGGSGGSNTIDVASFLQPLQKSLSASISDLTNSIPGGGAVSALGNQAADTTAAGQIAVNKAKAAASLKLQQDNAASAAQWGFTPGAPSGTLAILSQHLADSETKVLQQREMILAKQKVGLTDNPLDWIINQITLPFDIATFNNQLGARDDDLEVIHKLQAATFDSYRNNEVLDQANAGAILDGQNKIALGQALEAKSKTAAEVARIGISAVSVRLAANQDQFNSAVALNSATVNAADLAIKQRGLAISEQQLDLAKTRTAIEQNADARAQQITALDSTIKKLEIGNIEEKQQSMQALNDSLQRVGAVYHLQAPSWQQLQIMGDGKTKEFWLQGISNPDVMQGRLGFDAASALQTSNSLNLPLTPGINYVREKLIGWENDAIAKEGGGITWKAFGPEVQHFKLQSMIQDRASQEVKNVPNEGGIFSPPPLLKTLQMGQGDQAFINTKLGQAMAPLANGNPLYATKADDLFANAALLVQKGQATPAEMAAEINKIYTAILVDNNDVRQYSLLGLKAPVPGVEGFKTTVQTGTGFGSKQLIDMTSPAAVEGMLTRLIIRAQGIEGISQSIVQ